MYVCDNCGQRYDHEDQLKHVFPDIPGLLERLEPGGVVPAGECPACGALAYPERPQVRVAILLDTSASMGRDGMMEAARAAAENVRAEAGHEAGGLGRRCDEGIRA